MINPKTEKIAILDETKSQNVPNTSRILFKPGTKNIIRKPPVKFGINVIGFQGINCKSYMEENTKNNAFTFLKTLCNFRSLNTENKKVKQQIKEAISNPNLKIEHIQQILTKKQLSDNDLINKINNELYNENPKQKGSLSGTSLLRRMSNFEKSHLPA